MRPLQQEPRLCGSAPPVIGAPMCLGIPGLVVDLHADDPHRATAEVEGARREISIALFADGTQPPIERGEWVLIHVGFAMSRIDEHEAHETLRSLHALGEVYEGEREEFAAAGEMDPLDRFGGPVPRRVGTGTP